MTVCFGVFYSSHKLKVGDMCNFLTFPLQQYRRNFFIVVVFVAIVVLRVFYNALDVTKKMHFPEPKCAYITLSYVQPASFELLSVFLGGIFVKDFKIQPLLPHRTASSL